MRQPSASFVAVRRRVGAVAVVVAAFVAGCSAPRIPEDSGCEGVSLDALNSPYPANSPAARNGTSEFLLEPDPPVLTPGAPNRFHLRFVNEDCRPFVYRQPMWICGGPLVSIGEAPLLFAGAGQTENLSLHPLNFHSCGFAMGAKYEQVESGDAYERTVLWDGGIDVFDHADAENGVAWEKRRYYLGAGPWPFEYGFSWGTSYPVAKSTTIDVAENDLNRDSPLERGACGVLRAVAGASVEGTVETSRASAPIGTPVDVWANYTLHLPEPGCYMFEGEPNVAVAPASGNSWVRHSLGERCVGSYASDNPFLGVVDARSTQVDGRLHFVMDGGPDPTSRCRPALEPGRYNVTFEFGGGLYWSAPGSNPVAVFDWL
ncbi:MAG: hypothetical protein HYT80_11535 [Euryarchaeota archaeon]|nr:hypothetical protein [Euryarchaeota archaeon]